MLLYPFLFRVSKELRAYPEIKKFPFWGNKTNPLFSPSLAYSTLFRHAFKKQEINWSVVGVILESRTPNDLRQRMAAWWWASPRRRGRAERPS